MPPAPSPPPGSGLRALGLRGALALLALRRLAHARVLAVRQRVLGVRRHAVLAAAAVDLVGEPVARVDVVVVGTRVDGVLALVGADAVLARAALDLVVAAAAAKPVVAGQARDGVVAALAEDGVGRSRARRACPPRPCPSWWRRARGSGPRLRPSWPRSRCCVTFDLPVEVMAGGKTCPGAPELAGCEKEAAVRAAAWRRRGAPPASGARVG